MLDAFYYHARHSMMIKKIWEFDCSIEHLFYFYCIITIVLEHYVKACPNYACHSSITDLFGRFHDCTMYIPKMFIHSMNILHAHLWLEWRIDIFPKQILNLFFWNFITFSCFCYWINHLCSWLRRIGSGVRHLCSCIHWFCSRICHACT